MIYFGFNGTQFPKNDGVSIIYSADVTGPQSRICSKNYHSKKRDFCLRACCTCMDCAHCLHCSSCLRLLRPSARARSTSSVVTVTARTLLPRATTAAEGASVLVPPPPPPPPSNSWRCINGQCQNVPGGIDKGSCLSACDPSTDLYKCINNTCVINGTGVIKSVCGAVCGRSAAQDV